MTTQTQTPLADEDIEMLRSMFAGTIHNIGNVVTMATLAVTELEEAHGTVSPPLLDMVIDEMLPTLRAHAEAGSVQEFLSEDAQGSEYLGAIHELLDLQRKVIIQQRGTIETLSEKLDHISQVIALQQQLLVGLGTVEWSDLTDIVDAALKMTGPSISRHGVEILRSFEAAPPVHVDASAMTQVVINLIKNAVEALDEVREEHDTCIALTTRCETTDDGEVRAIFRIEDNGPGMTKEVVGMAFDFGFTTKPRTSGDRGVGLSFCRQTVERHGGTLTVETEPNQGAIFTICLPVEDNV